MMKALLLSHYLMSVLCVMPSQAQRVVPLDADGPNYYEYELPLLTQTSSGLIRVKLSADVYQKAKSPFMVDLRIYDAKGNSQPRMFYEPPDEVSPPTRYSVPAKLFPVFIEENAKNVSAYDLDIRTNETGHVTAVSVKTKGKNKETTELSSYVIDLGPAEASTRMIEKIRVFPEKESANYSAEAWLEASSDLQNWQVVSVGALRWLLNDQGQLLMSDTFEFPAQAVRYARVSWKTGKPIKIARVEVIGFTPNETPAPEREILWVSPKEGRFPGDWVYRMGIALPVDRLTLRTPESNVVFPYELGRYEEVATSKGPEFKFYAYQRGTYFQISQNNLTKTSADVEASVAFRQSPSVEWVLRSGVKNSPVKPDLGVMWRPQSLLFVASGNPPYSLRFGRMAAFPEPSSMEDIIQNFSAAEINQSEWAKIGDLKQHQAQTEPIEAVKQEAKAKQGAKAWLLWTALVLGLATLVFFSFKLFREMKPSSGGQTTPLE